MRVSQTICQQRKFEKIKSNPEKYKAYLEYRRAYSKRKGRIFDKDYPKELRKIAIELGNCSHCFKPKENPNYKMCDKCREWQREYYHKKKEAKK